MLRHGNPIMSATATNDAARKSNSAMLTFDLPTLIAQARGEMSLQRSDQRAITVFHEQWLRIVLMVLRTGTLIPPHQVEGPISVQVVEGSVKFSTDTDSVILKPGQVLTLMAQRRHWVEALEKSAFLLTRVTT